MALEDKTAKGTFTSTPIERLSLLISLLVIGLSISLVLTLPSRVVEFSALGSRATLIFSGGWLFAIVLAALTATGVESIHRSHPRVHLSTTRYTAILWILPCVLVSIAVFVLPALGGSLLIALSGIVITALLLGLIVLAEFHTIDVGDPAYATARLGLNLAVYVIAIVLFWALYILKVRSLLSAPVIALVSGLLALELLRGSESDVRRTWLYGATVGLAMGELLWAINYWSVGGLQASVLLTLAFYVITSIAQQYLWGYLSRWMIVEFIAVALVVLVLVSRFG